MLQDVKRNQGTLAICVTFLDFKNHFSTISLPAVFLLLRKFGLNENNVQALESYYEHPHMLMIHADSEISAKILPYPRLRQGCPLLPILGAIMINAMLLWLKFKGGGLSQGDALTNSLCFADDSWLYSHDDKCARHECCFSLREKLLPMGWCEDQHGQKKSHRKTANGNALLTSAFFNMEVASLRQWCCVIPYSIKESASQSLVTWLLNVTMSGRKRSTPSSI